MAEDLKGGEIVTLSRRVNQIMPLGLEVARRYGYLMVVEGLSTRANGEPTAFVVALSPTVIAYGWVLQDCLDLYDMPDLSTPAEVEAWLSS